MLAGCAKKAEPAVTTSPVADTGLSDNISSSGNVLTIWYDANPTTGYTWKCAISDESVLKLTDDRYVENTADSAASGENGIITGAGGREVFTFNGLKKGNATITLTYAQQWKGGDTADTETIDVEVGDGGSITSALPSMTEYSSSSSILFKDSSLMVTFDANPTTGYTWASAISDEKLIKQTDDRYVASSGSQTTKSEPVAGSGGSEKFTFQGLAKGTAIITFTYAQQWKGGQTADTRKIKVEIGDNGSIVSAGFAD